MSAAVPATTGDLDIKIEGVPALIDRDGDPWIELATDRWWCLPVPGERSCIGPDDIDEPGRSREDVERNQGPLRDVLLTPSLRAAPRRFVLQRDQDATGRSGVGRVAEGVEFTDGWVALRWTGCERVSTVLWPSIADVEAINGHGGATRVVWLDEVAA